jgi:hypothetical protein
MAKKQVIIDSRASEVPSASWESKVYHLPKKFEQEPEWKAIEKVVKSRDKHTCQSCGIKIGLTVHHILPRKDGGESSPPNLITLCSICHNEIEELGFNNRLQIVDYKRKRKYIKQDTHLATNDRPIRWQQWVYGGYKRI